MKVAKKIAQCILISTTLFFMNAVAFAQSSVTLYGLVDTGVEYVSHANTAGQAVVRIPSVTGELPSRWGLRGLEDLGGGYSAIFTLESGFNVRGGDLGQGGRLFGRQAFVGIKSPYGTIAFGRQYTMTLNAILSSDILGPDIYGMGTFDGYVPNARADNAVTYLVAVSGLTFGASYSFGRDSTGTGNSPGQGTCVGSVPGRFTDCHDWSAMLKYDAAYLGVATSYEEERGGAASAANFFDGIPPVSTANGADRDIRAHISAYVKLGDFKVAGGWLHRELDAVAAATPDVRSNLFFLGATYPLSPAFIVDGEVFRMINAEHDTRATMGTLRGTYLLSKQTALYAQLAYLGNSAKAQFSVSGGGGGTTPAPGVGQTGVMVGIRHFF